MIFHIPPDTGERLGFGITILLNITMYMNLISEKLPEASNNQPMLGTIFVTLFYLLSTGLAISVCTMAFSRWNTPIPDLFQKLFFKDRKSKCPPCKGAVTPDLRGSNIELSEIQESENHQINKKKVLSAQTSNEANWFNLTRSLDSVLFYIFLALLVIIPAIICSSLDTKALGI